MVRFVLEHDPQVPAHARVRARVPVPLQTLQRPHAVHAVSTFGTPAVSTGQGKAPPTVQVAASMVGPTHTVEQFPRHTRMRDAVPAPHVALQADHGLQSPHARTTPVVSDSMPIRAPSWHACTALGAPVQLEQFPTQIRDRF